MRLEFKVVALSGVLLLCGVFFTHFAALSHQVAALANLANPHTLVHHLRHHTKGASTPTVTLAAEEHSERRETTRLGQLYAQACARPEASSPQKNDFERLKQSYHAVSDNFRGAVLPLLL